MLQDIWESLKVLPIERTILFSDMLKRSDEQAAAAEDDKKKVVPAELGAFIAFPDFAGLETPAEMASAVQSKLRSPESYYGLEAICPKLQNAFFDGHELSFSSSVISHIASNDIARVRIFERSAPSKVVVLVPYWNASPNGLLSLAKLLYHFGYTVALLTLPYHAQRARPGSEFADYFVSANLGRTIASVRQAVADVYGVVSWLERRGHREFSIVGTSLGSCIAGIASAFDHRIRKAALVLTAGSFADVVCSGRSTRHISVALQTAFRMEEIRSIWDLISLHAYCLQFKERNTKLLLLSAKQDTVVMPELTRDFLSKLKKHNLNFTETWLDCGHYTIGRFPFNLAATWSMVKFLGS